jgi:hypothetical protein
MGLHANPFVKKAGPIQCDVRGHKRGCVHYDPAAPRVDDQGHLDFYCDCHSWKEPKVLAHENIAWPAGWTETQALAWRAKNGLTAPSPI